MLALNLPEVVAEVSAAYERYEAALAANNVAVLNEIFWTDPRTIRYGPAENLYGHDEIAAYRQARTPTVEPKIRSRTVVTTYGTDMGTVNTMFGRDSVPGRVGRQSQTWLRTPDGWRVVCAHVSMINR